MKVNTAEMFVNLVIEEKQHWEIKQLVFANDAVLVDDAEETPKEDGN